MRPLLTILLICVVASCKNYVENKPQQIHSSRKSSTKLPNGSEKAKDFSIAWIDSVNERVFIVTDSSVTNNIKKIRGIINEIKSRYDFGDKLNISFFSNVKYADYKTEVEAKRGISFHEFHLNYLGEFTQATKEYWTYPGLPDKKLKYIVE